jgi:hypothetical protein
MTIARVPVSPDLVKVRAKVGHGSESDRENERAVLTPLLLALNSADDAAGFDYLVDVIGLVHLPAVRRFRRVGEA